MILSTVIGCVALLLLGIWHEVVRHNKAVEARNDLLKRESPDRSKAAIVNDYLIPIFKSKKVYQSRTKEYKGEEWKSISYRYRQSKNWICEQCNLNLDANRHLLHTHHIDRDAFNHSSTNLKALCIRCHHEEPYHDFSKSESFIEFHKKYKVNSFWNAIGKGINDDDPNAPF